MTVNHTHQTDCARVAIYLRSASTPQGDPGSALAVQSDALTATVRQYGLEPVSEYRDAGVGGLTLDRPGLARLLHDARANPRPFDIVLVADVSRISRNPVQGIEVATQLAKLGVRLITADQAAPFSAMDRK